eukprot:5555574-Pleurochrysis_carterae.AAC.1
MHTHARQLAELAQAVPATSGAATATSCARTRSAALWLPDGSLDKHVAAAAPHVASDVDAAQPTRRADVPGRGVVSLDESGGFSGGGCSSGGGGSGSRGEGSDGGYYGGDDCGGGSCVVGCVGG